MSSALNPYAVTPEPRTDSKPFRRRFVRKTGFGSCRRKFLQDYFRQSFESSPGVQRVATLGVFLRYFLHAAKSTNPFPLRESFEVFQTSNQLTQNNNFARTKLKPFSKKESRFCKPRFSSPQWRLRTNKIKTFPKEDSRFCKPRFSTHRQQLCTSPIKSFRRLRRTFPGRFATLYSRFRRMVFLPRQAYARSRKTALLMPSIISAVTFSKMSS